MYLQGKPKPVGNDLWPGPSPPYAGSKQRCLGATALNGAWGGHAHACADRSRSRSKARLQVVWRAQAAVAVLFRPDDNDLRQEHGGGGSQQWLDMQPHAMGKAAIVWCTPFWGRPPNRPNAHPRPTRLQATTRWMASPPPRRATATAWCLRAVWHIVAKRDKAACSCSAANCGVGAKRDCAATTST